MFDEQILTIIIDLRLIGNRIDFSRYFCQTRLYIKRETVSSWNPVSVYIFSPRSKNIHL